jgi:hypothetical protein
MAAMATGIATCSMYLPSIPPIATFSEALSKRCFSHRIGIGTGSSITLAASAQILFSEIQKFSKLTLYKEQIFVTEKSFEMF